MAKTIKGRTEDAVNPFLNAEFWKKGTKVSGIVQRVFTTSKEKGLSYTLALNEPVEIEGQPEEVVNIGSKGLQMALQASNEGRGYRLKEGDFIVIECTGVTPPTPEKKKLGYSPRVNFDVEITPGNEAASDEPPVADSQFA